MSNTIEQPDRCEEHETIDVPFEPCVKIDRNDGKLQFERCQSIVCMQEYLNISSDELRLQFYTKMASRTFKSSAFFVSGMAHGNKKTVAKESQTDEDLTNEKKDMAGIWSVLECPVCLDVVLPPIHQCKKGHHVCSTCWGKVPSCPLCKCPKLDTRNYMAEALIEQIPLPCKYRIYGCKINLQHNNKVSHEETCFFRSYLCPFPQCKQVYCYKSMCKHVKNAHKNLLKQERFIIAEGEKYSDVLYVEKLSVSILHAFYIRKWGLFFLQEITLQHSSALYIQVIPAANKSAYLFDLEVSDFHDRRKECFKGHVFSLGKCTEKIIKEKEYLSVSQLLLENVTKTTPLKIIIQIWKL